MITDRLDDFEPRWKFIHSEMILQEIFDDDIPPYICSAFFSLSKKISFFLYQCTASIKGELFYKSKKKIRNGSVVIGRDLKNKVSNIQTLTLK